ncbi:MAG TPA: DUF1080 domain-containing protein [Candidatus Sulfotelmatobacter sp.]|nr:DUF1080 domain-containing protein [Candidatus Sulfotelmatobacter sp.]
MNRFRLSSLLVLLAGLAVNALAGEAAPKDLFNGRDLTGWVAMHGGQWSIENGVLIGHDGTNWSTNPQVSGSWLRTEKEYGDFVLELEYAINAKGNSGIHFRAGLEKNPSFTGYEMQILDDAGREPKKTTTGSLYDVVVPTKNMSKPAGEWNKVRITCKGNRIQVNLNGEDIIDFQGDRRTRGYIGFQNHDNHAVVKFRKIRLTEL